MGATRAVDDVSFDAAAGQLLVLLGPSGCGKSTTLRLIAGLEGVSAGRIHIGEDDVTDLPPARVEGAGVLATLWKVYVPLARPVYVAYALVSISYHWNNFLWPLIATNSVTSRPLTVGLQIFSSTDQGVDWSIITAATLMTSAPLLIAFLLFQRQFVQSFMRAGIR